MSEHQGRVLVALPGPVGAEELLELAARIAARRRLGLHALIREAGELATAGALPFVAEIDRWSGVRHTFDAAAAARAMARLAHDCERRLREHAAARRLDLVLEAVQGSLVGRALAALAADDVLLLGSRAAWAAPAAQAAAPRRVGVVVDGVDERVARALAEDLRAPGLPSPAPADIATLSPQVLGTDAAGIHDCDILVVSRLRAAEHGGALQRFLVRPRRLVVVLP